MSTSSATTPITEKAKKKPATKRTISLESFLERYPNREDAYRYEWNNGLVEKTPRTMNRDQVVIFKNLIALFSKTKAFSEGGTLISELDMYLPKANRTRRGDIVYLSPELVSASQNNNPTVCPFVIEVISKNDQINSLHTKIEEYFNDGVQVLWVILPATKTVYVYRSVRDVTVCKGADVCDAAPVLEDFRIEADGVFG